VVLVDLVDLEDLEDQRGLEAQVDLDQEDQAAIRQEQTRYCNWVDYHRSKKPRIITKTKLAAT
jgi:hypothetical protein